MSYFQNLCSALDETFAATVQSEDELSYASATLILAGLLQIHARAPRYASHRARLESFPNHHCSNTSLSSKSSDGPSAIELASAGFFHTGSGDETVCPACGLGLRDWQATDQPEACHVAYSTAANAALEMTSSEEGIGRKINPSLPCLYLAVHRLLVSELPLARKSLVPVGPIQSVLGLPGVVSRPVAKTTHTSEHESMLEYPSLADRLRAIAQIMSSPPSPQGWPVENARTLGHSDDLIVLALWRLQAEAAGFGLACPPKKSLQLDPHATAELLRAILRVQEGFDSSLDDHLGLDVDGYGELNERSASESSDNDLTAEDAETAALSRCRCRHIRPTPSTLSDQASPHSVDSEGLQLRRIRLPKFHQFLVWWSNRWPVDPNLPVNFSRTP